MLTLTFKKIYPHFCYLAIVLVISCSFKLKVTLTVNDLPANSAETKTLRIELVRINPLDYEKGR